MFSAVNCWLALMQPFTSAGAGSLRDGRLRVGSRFAGVLGVATFRGFRALALITVSPARRIVPAADEQMIGHSVACDVVGRRQCPLWSMPM